MAAVVRRRPPWFIVFLRSTSMVDVFCTDSYMKKSGQLKLRKVSFFVAG
jgi:hypothetical protein